MWREGSLCKATKNNAVLLELKTGEWGSTAFYGGPLKSQGGMRGRAGQSPEDKRSAEREGPPFTHGGGRGGRVWGGGSGVGQTQDDELMLTQQLTSPADRELD